MIPDNNILDIIISIVLIYALLSILASIIECGMKDCFEIIVYHEITI